VNGPARKRSCGRYGLPLVVALAFLATTSAGAQTSVDRGSTYPGARLTTVAEVPVFASFLGPQTPSAICPREPLPLSAALVRKAAVAVARAMPAFYRRARKSGSPAIDARGARATAGRLASAHAGTSLRRFCGDRVWRRSAFVAVYLPHVHSSASLSRPSFDIARTNLGWIIWAEVH
jgi:hypothetical protein